MDTVFSVNGKSYKAREFDFNLMCDLEEMGVDITQADTKPMSMIRAYFSLCANKSIEFAGREMQEHLIEGGSFDDISNAMSKMMEESGFFQALTKKSTEKAGASPKKTRAKAEKTEE